MAYRNLTMVRWAFERVDMYTKKIRQSVWLVLRELGWKGIQNWLLSWFSCIPSSSDFNRCWTLKPSPSGDLIARAKVHSLSYFLTWVSSCCRHSPHHGATYPTKSGPISNVICSRCSSKGHMAKDCWGRGTCCYQCGEVEHWAQDCSGKKTGEGISARLLPHQDVNVAFQMPSIYVDGMQCLALIDTGCFQTIMDADHCWS